jgi:two-component sensor histidine kinase
MSAAAPDNSVIAFTGGEEHVTKVPMTNLNNSVSRRLRLWPLWIALAAWIGFVAFDATLQVVSRSESWPTAFAHACYFWLLWVFFLPIVIWLSLRFPLQQPRVPLQIVLHLMMCAFIVFSNQLVTRAFLPLPPPPTLKLAPPPDFKMRPMSSGMRAAPDILIYLATMSACVAFAHFRQSQQRARRALELEARLAQSQLHALRMQINPHFLFNTLNAISTFVHTDPQIADEMITDLSEMFRASLETSDGAEIALSQEMDLLSRYLSIERRRFGERLQVEKDISPEVAGALVPTLILQPLVENAIRHGIEPQTGVGRISIRGCRRGSDILLSVCDNGTKEVKYPLAQKNGRHSIGLANVQERLQRLYGREQLLSVEKGELGGWKVELKIPFHSTTAKQAD